jgi:UDP-N-acetylglucosamine:LPS N-acetylglucosamine transferase
VLIEEHEFTVDRLVAEIESLRADTERLGRIGAAARSAGETHRSDRLVRLIERVGR